VRPGRWGERLLFLLFFVVAGAMLATGVLIEQIPETLFNATLV
jgi:hypothetical protein